MKTRNEYLKESLEALGIVEVINIKETKNSDFGTQIVIHMRTSSFKKALQVSGVLLDEAARSDWHILSSLQHIRKDKRDLFAPTLVLQAIDIDDACKDVCRILDIVVRNKSIFEDRVAVPAIQPILQAGGVIQVDKGGSPITNVRLDSYPLGMKEGRNVKKTALGPGVRPVGANR